MIATVLVLVSGLWQPPDSPILSLANAPEPPYTFLEEFHSGTSPKVMIKDANGRRWIVKGGHEAKPETFSTWFVRSLGYHADGVYFVKKGTIHGLKPLKRAWWFIQRDTSFRDAAFELVDPEYRYVEKQSWRWDDPELNRHVQFRALKVVVMLLSNWDNKDSTNRIFGTNTGVAERPDGSRVYYVTDWGETLGRWGRFYGRKDWNCSEFAKQTPHFVRGVKKGYVRFGFAGQHTRGFRDNILVSDVAWLLPFVERLFDAHVRAALKFSGASPQEEDCFTAELGKRVDQLRKVVSRQ